MSKRINRGTFLFVAALLVALCAQCFVVLSPILQRDMPVELDDALVYEVKAAQIETCFWQDCPGMLSLKEQLGFEGQEYVDWPKFRMARSFLHIYHPGHSIMLAALQGTGLSWEAAFDLSRVVGSVFIVGCIAYWALAFFGGTVATVFLLLLSVTLFPEQGIHMVTPGSLTSGVAFLMLGLIPSRRRIVEPALVVGTAVMLSLHSIAIVLAPFIWGFYFFYHRWAVGRTAVLCAGLSAALVLLTIYSQKFVSTPMFHLPVEYRPEGTSLADQILQNVQVAASTIIAWFTPFGVGRYAILPVALLCLWGYLRLDESRRRSVAILGALLAVFLLGGMAMVFPAHPGLLFYRAWVFASALGLGLFASALVDLARRSLAQLRARSGPKDEPSGRGRLGRIVAPTALVLSTVLTLMYGISGAGSIAREAEIRTTRHEYDLRHEQVGTLLSQAAPDSLVYYFSLENGSFSSREPMLFYFTHGAMNLKAYTDFITAGQSKSMLQGAEFAAGWNPVISLPNGRRHGLVLRPGDVLEIDTGTPVRVDAISLSLDRAMQDTLVTVEAVNGSELAAAGSIGATDGWHAPFEGSGRTSLVRVTTNTTVDLTGIGLDANAQTFWPWGQGRVLTVRSSDGTASVVSVDLADIKALRALPPGCKPSVLDDSGALFLLRLDNCSN